MTRWTYWIPVVNNRRLFSRAMSSYEKTLAEAEFPEWDWEELLFHHQPTDAEYPLCVLSVYE